MSVPRLRSWLPGLWQARFEAASFRRRWGFRPPPPWSDSVGYETLLEEIERNSLQEVAGDALEIGSLLGGGTAKLCGWFARHSPGSRVVAVDVFDPDYDPTTTLEGWTMRELYAQRIRGRSQRETFDEVTRSCTNLIVVEGNSTAVDLPTDRLAFAFIDGSHVPADVRSDFELAFSRLAPGGIAAFHDYGGNLPGVTHTLHACIGERANEIARIWTRAPTLLFVQRNPADCGP